MESDSPLSLLFPSKSYFAEMYLLQGYSKWSEDYYQQNCDGFYIHYMNIKFHLRPMKFLVFKSHLLIYCINFFLLFCLLPLNRFFDVSLRI